MNTVRHLHIMLTFWVYSVEKQLGYYQPYIDCKGNCKGCSSVPLQCVRPAKAKIMRLSHPYRSRTVDSVGTYNVLVSLFLSSEYSVRTWGMRACKHCTRNHAAELAMCFVLVERSTVLLRSLTGGGNNSETDELLSVGDGAISFLVSPSNRSQPTATA